MAFCVKHPWKLSLVFHRDNRCWSAGVEESDVINKRPASFMRSLLGSVSSESACRSCGSEEAETASHTTLMWWCVRASQVAVTWL